MRKYRKKWEGVCENFLKSGRGCAKMVTNVKDFENVSQLFCLDVRKSRKKWEGVCENLLKSGRGGCAKIK